jgi:biotin synthase
VQIISSIHNELNFSRERIIELFESEDESDYCRLIEDAEKLMIEKFDNYVKIIGQINFSNYCEDNCNYCDLREENFSLDRYRSSADDIISKVIHVSNLGLKSIILESGKDTYFDTDIIAYIIYSIKQKADISIILSLGERGFDEYKRWKLAGADSYLLKFETSNPKMFAKMHNNMSLDVRLRHLNYLKKIGFRVGSGNIVGLPEQSNEDLANDIFLSRELNIDFLVLSSFIPLPFTPIQNYPACSEKKLNKFLSLARLVLESNDISYLSAGDTVTNEFSSNGLKSGTNTAIINFPFEFEEESLILYPSEKKNKKSSSEIYFSMKLNLESLGKKVSQF